MNGKSYGEIVAATVLNTLVDTIKSHPNHSNEEYYQWLVKHFIDIIKNIKVK
jgi:urate oxidase